MMHCRRWFFLVVLLGTSIAPAAAASAAPSKPGSTAWPPSADLVREPESIHLPQNEGTQESLREAYPGLREFLAGAPLWKATVDPYAHGVDTAFGDGLASPGVEALGKSKDFVGGTFLEKNPEPFAPGLDLPPTSLVLNDQASIALPDPEARIVRLDLHKDGLPVLGAGVTFAMRDDKIFFVATSVLAPVATSSIPRLDASAALASVVKYVGDAALPLRLVREPSLAFYPRLENEDAGAVLRHHLIWVLEARPEQARVWEGTIAYVDAHDGQVLAFFPEARTESACAADPKLAHATVQGGVRASRATDVDKSLPLPFVHVNVSGTLFSADLNGRFPYFGGAATSDLEGDFFRVHCDSCTNPSQPVATGDESGDVDFGQGGASTPSPVTGNGKSTPADRTTYFHLNQERLLLKKWNNAFFNEVDAFVNINAQCNAFSSGYMLGFYRGGGNCNNTGEIRGVVQHELGHTWDRTDGNDITDGGMSEWKADSMALMIGGESCAGPSFFISGGPTSTCSGVRDLDEKAPGRTDHPLTPAECPTCATLTRTANNCGGEVHCVGEISGQTMWHLLNNLMTGTDYVTGAPLPAGNPGMSPEQARWILERLYIGGGATMRTWDPTVAGTSEYNAVTIADDDDGNLSNGTPHAAYINAAFAHHGIDESQQVADSADCAPLSDPLVSAVLDRDPATALPFVRIDWTPVGGATTFDVYRNTRNGDAFLPLAQNVSAGPIVDSGVQVGTTYRYLVAAVRKTGCANISPGANVVTVGVGSPELKVVSKVLSESPGGSDGDGRLEPGERVLVQVSLQETGGTAGATGVSATLTSASPTFAPVVAGGPVSFGTVPAGGTAAGSGPFEVMIGPSIPCGGTVHLVVSITGNEGCWLDGIDVPVTKTADGCAVSSSAFVEVVPGSPAVTSAGGDADGIADNCETTRVAYQVRNSGTLASGPVVSTASTPQAGVTFVPRPDCGLANLDPGQTSTCQFNFSLGGATSAGVPFTLTANSAGNPAPSRFDFVLPAETNPPVFSTMTYNFDTPGFQGWSHQKFILSFVHPFSGSASLHAGSITTSNICAAAASPALLLDPSNASTLSMQVWGDIEPLSDFWYDRANVEIVDLSTNTRVPISPTGFPYNASDNVGAGLCHVDGQAGWAGSFTSWNLATFDLSAFRGHNVQIQINYNTDEGDNRDGIYVDDVTLTNAASATLPPDAQPNTCSVPEVSPAAAPVPLLVSNLPGSQVRFTWQDLGAAFQYSLYAGTLGSFYNHGAGQVVCQGRGAGIACNGASCTFDAASAALPAGNLYFLVTAAGFGTEGTAGFASSGAERDPAQSSCAP